MGAAAEHRGNDLIRRHAAIVSDQRRRSEDQARAIQIAEDCNEFTRQAMALIIEPKGLRQNTVERAKSRRGWGKRHAALVSAHNTWVDADSRNLFSYVEASINRARAAYSLLVFALGCWTIPDHIKVPRPAQ